MSREALERWKPAALQLEKVCSSRVAPVHVLTTEAIELVRFCRDNWDAVDSGEQARPGLCQAQNQIGAEIAEELLDLQYALHAAQSEYLLTLPLIHGGLRKRAENVLRELVSAIEGSLQEGPRDECDQQLECLRQSHAQNPSGLDALGAQLADYAALASQMRPRLAALSRFHMPLIDDAHHLARELHDVELDAGLTAASARALDLRNRIAALLIERLERVRAVAAELFRAQPHIAHQAESSFERRMHALRRLPRSHISELAGRTERAAGS